MSAKLHILVCDMEPAMQDSARKVSRSPQGFISRVDYHGCLRASTGGEKDLPAHQEVLRQGVE